MISVGRYCRSVLSVGTGGGIVAIHVGHELTHIDPRLEQWTGGALLVNA